MTIDYEKLLSLIRQMMDYYSIPGMALGIITPGKVHTEGFGIRDGAGHLFLPDTISGIGSCSKSMTAFAVMKLAEKGLLDIDEPVASYIPGFALWDEAASRQVTLRDMLCHRTGVGGHDGAWPDNSISRVDYLKRLKYLEPNAPLPQPGPVQQCHVCGHRRHYGSGFGKEMGNSSSGRNFRATGDGPYFLPYG